ncbi:MAG: flagellar basal body rod protein FlgC [Planctomycetes bacterium]|nr:flagellar basal body rod protein FlgC [Planctomycetota bacterium]
MIRALDATRSALVAERVRMDVIAGNIANAFATSQADGKIEPYKRRVVTFASGDGRGGPGVRVQKVSEDQSPARLVFDPGHPHAAREGPTRGYVRYPNVSVTMEYIDAIEAGRAYEANIAMMNVTRGMVQRAIQLLA